MIAEPSVVQVIVTVSSESTSPRNFKIGKVYDRVMLLSDFTNSSPDIFANEVVSVLFCDGAAASGGSVIVLLLCILSVPVSVEFALFGVWLESEEVEFELEVEFWLCPDSLGTSVLVELVGAVSSLEDDVAFWPCSLVLDVAFCCGSEAAVVELDALDVLLSGESDCWVEVEFCACELSVEVELEEDESSLPSEGSVEVELDADVEFCACAFIVTAETTENSNVAISPTERIINLKLVPFARDFTKPKVDECLLMFR